MWEATLNSNVKSVPFTANEDTLTLNVWIFSSGLDFASYFFVIAPFSSYVLQFPIRFSYLVSIINTIDAQLTNVHFTRVTTLSTPSIKTCWTVPITEEYGQPEDYSSTPKHFCPHQLTFMLIESQLILFSNLFMPTVFVIEIS